jgi:hypothetical protein
MTEEVTRTITYAGIFYKVVVRGEMIADFLTMFPLHQMLLDLTHLDNAIIHLITSHTHTNPFTDIAIILMNPYVIPLILLSPAVTTAIGFVRCFDGII